MKKRYEWLLAGILIVVMAIAIFNQEAIIDWGLNCLKAIETLGQR